MSHVHESYCNHDVRLCEKCDRCYCSKCSKEWGSPVCTQPHNWWTYPLPTWPNYPLYTTSGAGTVTTTNAYLNDVVAEVPTHVHGEN